MTQYRLYATSLGSNSALEVVTDVKCADDHEVMEVARMLRVGLPGMMVEVWDEARLVEEVGVS